MTIQGELTQLRTFLRDADGSIDISGMVLSAQTYLLEKHGHYKAAFWHGVHYYFHGWVAETRGSAETRRLKSFPKVGSVIGEFVESILDWPFFREKVRKKVRKAKPTF